MLCFILLLYCALPAAEGLEESSVNVIPLSVVTENSQNLVSYSYPSLMCSVEDEVTCPPGQFCKDGLCVCGVSPYNVIVCHGTHSFQLKYYSATFNEDKNLTEIGYGLLPRPVPINTSESGDLLYSELPDDIHELTKETCDSLNRTGTLCGRCLPDHYPLAYSYSMACICCPNVRWNWVRYIMAAYLPLTFFCLVILFFNINTTSSHLFAMVYYCQVLTVPLWLQGVFVQSDNSPTSYTLSVVFSFYTVWNLDFFRPFYSDISLGIGTFLPWLWTMSWLYTLSSS